jgi:hypothetical protein
MFRFVSSCKSVMNWWHAPLAGPLLDGKFATSIGLEAKSTGNKKVNNIGRTEEITKWAPGCLSQQKLYET